MKRKTFIQQLQKGGCVLLRHGAKHDIYFNPSTGSKQPVPRHSEIDEKLVKHIRRHLGLR